MAEVVVPVTSTMTPRRIFLATLTVATTAIAFLLLYAFRNVAFYFFIGVVLATALRPMVNWLHRRKYSHDSATVLVYITVFATIIGLMIAGFPLIVGQISHLAGDMPKTYAQLQTELSKSSSQMLRRVSARLPRRIQSSPAEASAEQTVDRVSSALGYSDWIYQGVFATLAVLLIAFYWSLQEERTVRALLLFLPAKRREPAREFIQELQSKLGAYVRGQGILCVTVGAFNFIALLIIGIPYATTLGIIAGILEAVPVFGPALGAAPGIVIALTTEPSKAIWVIMAAVIIQQLENYILVPRVMDRSVGVNPVVTLLGIAGFTALMGLPGAVLAIPLVAIVQMIVVRLLFDPATLEPAKPAGRDAVSVVRYHARDLVHDVRIFLRNKQETASRRNDSVEETIESIALEIDRQLSGPEPDSPMIVEAGATS